MTLPRPGRRGLLLGAIGAGLASALALAAWSLVRPAPTLDGLDALLASSRFDEAERRLVAFLRDRPDSPQANLLMAQVALARPDQKPRVALDHLARVRAPARAARAVVRLNEGKAFSALGLYSRAEASWLEALAIDPTVPEAGWALLGLYYVEGRRPEARRLGLALHVAEPDPRDRAQLLLELVRQDAKPIVAFTIIRALEPAVRQGPGDLPASVALAGALIRDDRPDEGLPILAGLVDRHPDDPRAWEALLSGLDEASRPDELARALARLPQPMAVDGRFARFLGLDAQGRRDWPAAVDHLLRARRFDPADAKVHYRLGRALRLAGREEEAARVEADSREMASALDEVLPLYNRANAVADLGAAPHPDLYRRLADLRERLGLRDEALAWHRLILRDRPDDLLSRVAVDRLADVTLPRLRDILPTPPEAPSRP